jgi:tetratricopeptide (TPR) repeat protein
MSPASSPSDELLSTPALRRVDDICARFEEVWKKGERPRLEEFLGDSQGPERTELLRELLRLERHYRQSAGEALSASDYERRFPNDVLLIRLVLAEGMTVDPSPPDEGELGQRRRELVGDGGTGDHVPGPPSAEGPVGAASSEPRFPVVPGYEVLAELGRGGMGVVYQARHTALKRLVALKMILSGDYASQDQLARFRKEAEALARLRHPNIIQIHEVGDVRGCPFFSLEFVEGGSLARYINGTPQPPRLAAGLVEALARAMHAAHQSGVVHRDLKPANVLLGRRPDTAAASEPAEPTLDTFEPKITDFGLAKRLDGASEQTHSGAILGTPSYMAPEQAEGRTREVGPLADVYALAAILYELLTGRPPFKGASIRDTLEQVCTREPVPPTQLQPKVPRDLETICLKGLRKAPNQRYATAQDLAEDLRRWLDGRPILARPVPAWERAWKFARRRPALAGLMAVALVALLAGSASVVLYSLYEQQKAEAGQREANQKAEAQERQARAIRTVLGLYDAGKQAEDRGQYGEAREDWLRARETLEAEPAAADEDMRRLLEGGIKRVTDRLSKQLEAQEHLAQRQRIAERRGKFEQDAFQVRFHAVRNPDQDMAAQAAAVRKEAPLALAQLGLDTSDPVRLGDGLAPLRPWLDPEQRKRLAEECIEVLLAWADAETEGPAPAGPKTALRLLAGADALGQAHELGPCRALHRCRAKCLQLLDDARGARSERECADAIQPATALDLFDVALEHYHAGRVPESSAACTRVLQLPGDHFWAQYIQALCYLLEKRWGEAEVVLNVCQHQRPDFEWLFPLLGIAHVGLQKYSQARSDFDRALQPSSAPALRAAALSSRSNMRRIQGRLQDAEDDLREAIRLQPNAYQGHALLAYLLRDRGDLRGALNLLDKALARSRKNTTLLSERARLRSKTGDLAGARDDFEAVIRHEGETSNKDLVAAAHVELAHLHNLAEENDAALEHCLAVLKTRPTFVPVQRQYAQVLLALKRYKEAGAALDQYLKQGGEPTVAVYRARGLIHAGQKDDRSAMVAYSQALALKRGQPHLPVFAAQTIASLAVPNATSWLRAVVDLNVLALERKEEAETLSHRGWAYLAQEAIRPALTDFDDALKLSPNDGDALAGRGMALALRGRPGDVVEAITAVERSLESGKKTTTLLVSARVYLRAAALVEAMPRRPVYDHEVTYCLKRAVALLRATMESVPRGDRPAFWRDTVAKDPLLKPLFRNPLPDARELLIKYGG